MRYSPVADEQMDIGVLGIGPVLYPMGTDYGTLKTSGYEDTY